MNFFHKIRSCYIALAAIQILFVADLDCRSQQSKVPLEIQFALLPKVLLLEKNLALKEKDIRVGIVYDNSSAASRLSKNKIFEFTDNPTYKEDNSKFQFIPIAIKEANDFQNTVSSQQLDAIYLTAEKSFSISNLLDICKKHKIISFTGIEEYFNEGVSVFFDIRNNKPKITINLQSAKKEGANFSSYLLRLANIIDNL